MARTVHCIKLGREAEGLDFVPYPGELGKKIFENVSKEAWQQWIRLQTMIINENRLNLADQRHRQHRATQNFRGVLKALVRLIEDIDRQQQENYRVRQRRKNLHANVAICLLWRCGALRKTDSD